MFQTLFRSEDVPPTDRFECWYDVMLNRSAPVLVTSTHTGHFAAQLQELDLGVAQVALFRTPAYTVRRTPTLVRRSDPECYKLALLHGGHRMSIRRRDTPLRAGDFVLFDTTHPFDEHALAGYEQQGQTVVSVPRAALPLPSHKVDQLLAVRLPGDSGLGVVVARFLHGLSAEAGGLQPRDMPRLGTIMLELVVALLAHHIDADSTVPPETQRQALLYRIHAFIDARLGNTGLSPQVVADAHHISMRYLHQLFHQQGITLGSWIRARRLEGCRRDLAEPLLASEPIGVIAARWGFIRPADFSRSFRAAYGISPRDYRGSRAARAGQCAVHEQMCALHAHPADRFSHTGHDESSIAGGR